MDKHQRFLDLYHAGLARAEEVYDYNRRWHGAGGGPKLAVDRHVSLHVYLGLTWWEFSRWATDGTLPTEEEHLRAPQQDVVFIAGPGDRSALHIHGPSRCRPPCPVHWPNDHPQADWPLGWDPAAGIMVRMCTHMRPHPDPDDQQVRLHPELAAHDCCGCCAPTIDGALADDRPAIASGDAA